MKLLDITFNYEEGLFWYFYLYKHDHTYRYYWYPMLKCLYISRYDSNPFAFRSRLITLPPEYLTYMLLKYP